MTDAARGVSLEELLSDEDGPYAAEAEAWVKEAQGIPPEALAAMLRAAGEAARKMYLALLDTYTPALERICVALRILRQEIEEVLPPDPPPDELAAWVADPEVRQIGETFLETHNPEAR